MPLGINEQTLRYGGCDSVWNWDSYAAFTLGSIFPAAAPGWGLRFTRQQSPVWGWGISWEHNITYSVDFGFMYRISGNQEIALSWGCNPGDRAKLLTQFHLIGDQRILTLQRTARMCGKYSLSLDSDWQIDLHLIRNEQQTDYIVGMRRSFCLWKQNWTIQGIWQDSNHSLYGNLKCTTRGFFGIVHGIYTESLGWSTGVTIGYHISAKETPPSSR